MVAALPGLVVLVDLGVAKCLAVGRRSCQAEPAVDEATCLARADAVNSTSFLDEAAAVDYYCTSAFVAVDQVAAVVAAEGAETSFRALADVET